LTKQKNLKKHTEQKALAATKINKSSVDYLGSTSNRGHQKGQNKSRGGKPHGQQQGTNSYNSSSSANKNSDKGGNQTCNRDNYSRDKNKSSHFLSKKA
jgi:hypothetical protein